MHYIHSYDSSAEYNQNINLDYNEPFVALVKDSPKGTKYYNNHRNNWFNYIEYVDLGLPSGTLWASMNVGAKNLGAVGDTFAWGEIAPKTTGDWSNYKWGTSQTNITKYNETDGKYILDNEDNVAYVMFGQDWSIPTPDDWVELHNTNYCTRGTVGNGVKTFTSTANGNVLCIPANTSSGDIALWSSVGYQGSQCYYANVLTYGVFSGNISASVKYAYRYVPYPIRPVCHVVQLS